MTIDPSSSNASCDTGSLRTARAFGDQDTLTVAPGAAPSRMAALSTGIGAAVLGSGMSAELRAVVVPADVTALTITF